MPGGRKLTRRAMMHTVIASAVAPLVVPSRLLGGDEAPSNMLQVGVVGTGGKAWGGAINLANHCNCRIRALCDPARAHMDRYRNHFNVGQEHCYTDFRELLQLEDIDAVLIATPDHWHALNTIAAAQAGKHIYCEKPLTNTIAEGQAVVRAVKESGVVFQHGTQLRSREQTRRVCELVRNGYIGDVSRVVIGSPPGIAFDKQDPQPVPDHLDWNMWQGPAPERDFHPAIIGQIPDRGLRGWYFISDYSKAGWIAGYGVHDIDLALWGLGLEHDGPVAIEGEGRFPANGMFDTVMDYRLTFTFADGRRIEMTDTGRNRHGVTFHGDNGRWLFCREEFDASDRDLLRIRIAEDDTALHVSRLHEQDFTDAIRNGTPSITPVDVAHRATSICLLGGICLQLGRPLRWDPQAERFPGDDEANALLQCAVRQPWDAAI